MNRYVPSILRVLVSLMSLLISIGGLRAQTVRFPNPEALTEQQGLPQAFVSSIIQDQKGFIWMATRDGLCRYDGQRFRVFQAASQTKTSLSFPDVYKLNLDGQGHLWIQNEHTRIDRFDPGTETFRNITLEPFYRRHFGRDTLWDIFPDNRGRLWLLLLNKGLICWDLRTNQFRRFRHTSQFHSLSSNIVRDVKQDIHGTIWVTSDGGLDRFDEQRGQFIPYPVAPGKSATQSDRIMGRMLVRKNGDLLIHSLRHLILLHTQTGRMRFFPLPPLGDHIWWEARFTSDSQGNDYLLWFNQIFRFNEQTGLQPLPELTRDIAAKSLFVDRSDVLWIGTDGAGVRKYDLSATGFERYPYHSNFITDLLVDQLEVPVSQVPRFPATTNSYHFRYAFDGNGLLWFNLGQPFYRLDLKTKQLQTIRPPELPGEAGESMYVPMATDPAGRIWAVYKTRAVWFDEHQQRWQVFPFPFSVGSDIQQMVVDKEALWIATQLHGLYRVDRVTGHSRRYGYRAGDSTSLNSDALFCLFADPLDVNQLWLGTFGSGLGQFDKRTGRVRRFTIADGLPNNVVYSAIPDRSGSIWIGTNKGIGRLNRRTWQIQNYNTQDGIQANEFNRFHFFCLPGSGPAPRMGRGPTVNSTASRRDENASERIIMGGLNGITAFFPDQIKKDTYQPQVELTGLQINNRTIRPGSGSTPGDLSEQVLTHLQLPYDQNFLNLEFAALQFNKPAKNQYRYRLEGLNPDWVITQQPVAVYTGLQPGRYRFLVNASNTSGIWSREIRQLTITIMPPVWATWWAVTVYVLLGFGLSWGLFRAYFNRQRLQQSIQLQQKELALQQQEADQLRAVNTIKTNFFTNITHEFRTPLTLILTPTEQLKEHIHEPGHLPQNRHRLDTIDRNAHQLLGLINQLLDLSKLEASVMPIHESRGNLTDFIRHWLVPLTEQAKVQGLDLTFDSEITGDYWFDAEKLERIVYNLTGNALKFTEVGTIAVSLTLSSGRIRLTVADTGIGIPAQHLPHIFDRFYQVGTTNATPGTGIGLALVQELVQLQGGQIWVESQPNQGTTFVVELPYRQADVFEAAVGVITPAHREIDADVVQESNGSDVFRLLVVEDNDELAHFIADSLPQTYRIRRALNGRDGLEQALEHLPDLIISDVMMPLMDGFTLCSQLKTDQRISHIPIILLTAKSSAENRLAGLSLGADDYLTKPFQLAELQLRVRNQLVSKQRQREWVRTSLSSLTLTAQAAPEPIDPFLSRLYALIDANLSDSGFGLEQMLSELKISRTHLFRKVKALTDLTAYELLRNYRLKRGAQLLRLGVTVSETAYQVGFESPAYFSKCFRQLYQLSPREFAARP